MTKLFKNSKQVLAFVFAIAVLAVSLFTGSININADAYAASEIDYWDGTKASSFAGGTGTESDPFIIKTAEQLALCCTGTNPANSTGKYFKVDDSVKVFVLQPQNVVDFDTLVGLNSAEATKDYLTGLSGVKNWASLGASGFNGNFDGNGVTVYGLYAVASTASQDIGLFPRYDGGYYVAGEVVGNVCKNIAVKNSYLYSMRRVGVISGASWGTGYDGKVDGIVRYDTIAVVNCYISTVGNQNFYNEQGIVVDGGSNDVSILNNVLVSGNYAFNSELGKKLGVVAANNNNGVKESNGALIKGSISNSIILGTDPFRKDLYSDMVFYNVKDADGNTVRTFFNNVVTDMPAGKITVTNPSGWGAASTTAEFAETNVKQVTSTGVAFKEETANNFDWENVWFMSENGPELREFHKEITLVTTKETHVWECQDCGIQSPGGVTNHTFVCDDELNNNIFDAYYCKECGYACQHNEQTNIAYEEGDCLTAPGTYSRCKFCPAFVATNLGAIPGHTLEYVDADPGHCEQDGHKAYWYCAECDNKFAAEDADGNAIAAEDIKYIAFDAAVSDDDLNTGKGGHIKAKDQFGVVLAGKDANGHWFTCEIDGGRINFDCVEIGEDGFVKHTYNNAQCKECGWVCENHDWKETGKKVVQGDCFTDEEKEIKCNLCGYKSSKVTKKAGHIIEKIAEVKATDKIEGTKEHYYCAVCDSTYADAAGTTVVSKASLVIPKVLPAEYSEVPTISESEKDMPVTTPSEDKTPDADETPVEDNETPDGEEAPVEDEESADSEENIDDSETSPETRDNVVSVVAVAALAGAAFVIARKARK